MKNLNITALVELKKAVNNGEVLQKVDVQNVTSHVVEDYSERSKKYSDIKNFIENRINGICVSVSGGGKTVNGDKLEYNPIIIKTFKNNERDKYNVIKVDGIILGEPNYASMIYDNYLDMIIGGSKYIENVQVSFYENVLSDALDNIYLTECGFIVSDGALAQFKDDKAYQLIDDIATEVEGIITILLPNEEEYSILVVCNDKNILLSDDCFIIDSEVTA